MVRSSNRLSQGKQVSSQAVDSLHATLAARQQQRVSKVDDCRHRYRKLSFGHDIEVAQEDLEVRSALAASSCSGNEDLQSHSDDADCSQSDISLCDDGGSDEGEGDHILGHLSGSHSASRAGEDSESQEEGGSKAAESYEDEEEVVVSFSSLQQHAKNSFNNGQKAQL